MKVAAQMKSDLVVGKHLQKLLAVFDGAVIIEGVADSALFQQIVVAD